MALDRLLRLSVPGYDPTTHLGGVCYLFLRGVGEGDAGIYHVPAGEIDMDEHGQTSCVFLMNQIRRIKGFHVNEGIDTMIRLPNPFSRES